MPKFMPDFLTPNDPMAINQFMAPVQQAMTRRVMPDLAPMVNATDPQVRKIMADITSPHPSASDVALGVTPVVGEYMGARDLYEHGLPELPGILANNPQFETGAKMAGPAIGALSALGFLMNRGGRATHPVMRQSNKLMNLDPAQVSPTAFGDQAALMPFIGPDNPNYMPKFLRNQAGVIGYHGTPHTFDKFSLDNVGTGEGAQAYGWGLYFAGKKDIAEFYKNTLSGDVIEVDGLKFNANNPDHMAAFYVAEKGDRAKGLSEAQKRLNELNLEFGNDPFMKDEIKFAERVVNAFGEESLPKAKITEGNLYQADIPDDHQLLDWDKPLSEQPESIQGPIKKIREQVRKSFPEYADSDDITGQGLYSLYRDHRGGSSKAASEGFNEAGIPGLRYLDATSRGKGEGSANYVIWHEPSIKKK